MSNIVPSQAVEYSNQRILTTEQLAASLGTTDKIISQNFTRNKDRYEPGRDYFLLEGDELKHFMSIPQNEELPRNLNRLYLWTERGAWLHAKSINTDQAWDAYRALVDDYYRLKEAPKETFLVLPVMDHVDTVLSLEQEMHLDVELHQLGRALDDLLRRRRFTDAELKSVIQALAADIDKFKIVVRAQDEFLLTVNRSFVEQAGVLKRMEQSGAVELLPTYPEMNHINLLAPDKPHVVQ